MISGIGVDIEDTRKFKKPDRRFIDLLFTRREIGYCMRKKEPYIHFAGKFCAKEALVKAYGKGLEMKDIEVVNSGSGKVFIYLKGKKQPKIHCSISHSENSAVAFVVVEK